MYCRYGGECVIHREAIESSQSISWKPLGPGMSVT